MSAANERAGSGRVSTFVCPSAVLPTDDPGVHYAFSLGPNIGFPGPGRNLEEEDQNGFLTGTVRVSFASILDGSSNVVAASEQVSGGTAGGVEDLRYGPNSIPPGMADAFPGEASLLAWGVRCGVEPRRSVRVARQWHRGLPGQTAFNTLLAPNSKVPNCLAHCEDSCDSDGPGLFTARRLHPGGVHAAMADGAVRWVSDSVSQPLWQRLGGRNDGRSVEGF